MSLNIKDVEFNIGTGAVGTDVAVTGFGFAPKAVLFFAIGRTESTDAGGAANTNRLIGFAAQTTEGGGTKHAAVCSRAENNVDADTADGRHRLHTDAVILALSTVGDLDGKASIQSWDADGFTLNIDDQFTVNQRVIAIGLGGSDITNIEIGAFSTPTAGSTPLTQDVTTGFTCADGEGVVFMIGGQGDTDNTFSAYATACLGVATAPGNSFNWAGSRRRNNPGTMLTLSALGTTNWYTIPNGAHSSLSRRATFNGWIAGGFRIQWEQITTLAARVYWMAIKGGRWKILDGLMASTATTVPLTGAGFAPLGGIVVGAMSSEDGGGSSALKSFDRVSLGVFSGAGSRRCVAQQDNHGTATSECGTRIEHDAAAMVVDASGAASALLDVQSLDADGVTFFMDDPDSLTTFFVALLAGNTSGGGGGGGAGKGFAYRLRRRR